MVVARERAFVSILQNYCINWKLHGVASNEFNNHRAEPINNRHRGKVEISIFNSTKNVKWTATQNDAAHSGGNANVFQVILCFSFGSISLDGQHDTLLLRSPQNVHNRLVHIAQHTEHNSFYLCVRLEPTTYAIMYRSVVAVVQLQRNKYPICLHAGQTKYGSQSKFYSKYQFHFYFTLEIWRNRLAYLSTLWRLRCVCMLVCCLEILILLDSAHFNGTKAIKVKSIICLSFYRWMAIRLKMPISFF